MTLKESASQTAGPYVHIGLTPNFSGITGVYPNDLGRDMVNDKTKGTRITTPWLKSGRPIVQAFIIRLRKREGPLIPISLAGAAAPLTWSKAPIASQP
jgi:hypothetical protein